MTNFIFLNDKPSLQNFCETNNISSLSLFGSHARGTAKKDSDVDLLIKFSKPVDFFELIDVEEKLENKLNKSVDLVTKNSVHEKILPYITKDLVSLYEKS